MIVERKCRLCGRKSPADELTSKLARGSRRHWYHPVCLVRPLRKVGRELLDEADALAKLCIHPAHEQRTHSWGVICGRCGTRLGQGSGSS